MERSDTSASTLESRTTPLQQGVISQPTTNVEREAIRLLANVPAGSRVTIIVRNEINPDEQLSLETRIGVASKLTIVPNSEARVSEQRDALPNIEVTNGQARIDYLLVFEPRTRHMQLIQIQTAVVLGALIVPVE